MEENIVIRCKIELHDIGNTCPLCGEQALDASFDHRHVKEFERLAGGWKSYYDRLNLQLNLAQQIKGVVMVKGAYTAIATSVGDIFFNNTGNPGMATAGSGDVLTGILTGLMAQGYEAPVAAVLGTYLHGLSGDLAARDKGEHSLIASDLIDYLPQAFREAARGK
jgi:NAD(P)H-hydrate epimerase